MKTPHWPVTKIKGLARAGKIVVSRTRAEKFFFNNATAVAAAILLIESLAVMDFVETRVLDVDVSDAYAVNVGGAGWYLKVTVVEPLLIVVSLHPLERVITTNKGKVKP